MSTNASLCLHCIMRHLRDTWNSVWMPCFTMKCIANFGCLRCVSPLSTELFHDKVYICVSACQWNSCVLWLRPTAYYVLSLTTSLHCSGTRQHTRCTSCRRSLRSVYRSVYSLVIVFLNHHGEDGQYKNVRVILQMYLQNTPRKERMFRVALRVIGND